MRPAALSTTGVLNDAGDLVARIAAPWIGVLWLTALPLRFMQVHFVDRVAALGGAASHYGDYLLNLAFATGAAFLLSLLGRAVFVRACALGLKSPSSPGREALRVPAASIASYVYTALLIEAAFFVLSLSLLAIPILITLAALAAATLPLNDRPGLVEPIRHIARHGRELGVLLAMLFVFGTAVVLAWVNLFFVFQAGVWLAGAVPGVDAARWGRILSDDLRLFILLTFAGGVLAVEPIWLASHVVYVHRVRAREGAEDLRQWFETLKTGAAR